MAKKKKFIPMHIKLERELDQEITKITRDYFGALCIVLYIKHGYRETRLRDIIQAAADSYFECAEKHDKSMIQMLDEEAHIELQNGDGRSWKDLEYLNDDKWDHKVPSREKMIVVRLKQKAWLRAQVMAGILLAMHRRHGFGPERCSQLYADMLEEVNKHEKMEETVKDCKTITGIDVVEFLESKRADKEKKNE